MKTLIKNEYPLILGIVTVLLFFGPGVGWLSDMGGDMMTTSISFIGLFGVMLWASFKVVVHADMLAIKLGEPFGTLILTLSVILIEVLLISSIMLTGEDNPTLGRDMMFSVIMIVLNGLTGLVLIIGGLKHFEQKFNTQGAQTYLIILIPLATLSLILPNYTQSSETGTFSFNLTWFEIAVTVILYLAFLFAQTYRHKEYFQMSFSEALHEEEHEPKSLKYHMLFLVAYMLIIILLSKSLSKIIDFGIGEIGFPVALGGLLVAVLVLAPEGMAAAKSSLRNDLQRAINISLGSGLSTISLTVPAVLMIGMFTGKKVILGLGPEDSFLLILTLAVSMVTFSGKRSNFIQGIVHLVLFLIYLALIFD